MITATPSTALAMIQAPFSDAGRLALAGVPGRVSRADRDTRTAGHVEDRRLAPSWRVTELFRDANAGAADNDR
jgi:hypothetical protein